jgi:OmcA/MtrC family decaheme c-type cytochrome
VAQSYSEGCALCHRSGSIADIAVVHSEEDNSPEGEITGVAIDDGAGTVTIDFSLFDSDNNLVPLAGEAADNIRFNIAKLSPDGDGILNWQNYINTTEVKAAGDPGSAPDGTTEIQGTAERASTDGGTFTDNGDGTYEYVMSIDINNITSPLAVTYEPTRTHRVAMQVSDNVANAVFDFVPNGDPVSETRDIAENASCNECHIKLGLHGGDRIQVAYCVTCHNPGSTDANSGNEVDFKVMLHKIHAGEGGPEVQDGGEYAIWGFRDSKHDYSTVVFPQDLRNCTKCHDGADAATADGDNWKNMPSTAACTACHDAPDADEYPSFPNLTATEIETAHEIPAQVAAAAFEFNIISITDTDPGDTPSVTFSITDPTNGDLAYDILNDAPFTGSGGASRLAILIGWETTNYTNTGSGSTPAQPVSIDPLAEGIATDNLDGTFTVTSPVTLPTTAVGSGVVGFEGHPAADFDEDGTYSDRVPVTSATEVFAITDSSAVARRTVVDIDNCKQCHGTLSLHGNNRTDNPQLCVICHNADATDIEVRPAVADAVDEKVEEAIDFKYMIHAIHAGDADEHGFREDGIVVYGFNSSIHDFSEVRLPNGTDNLANCAGCHDGSTFGVPLEENALPTTVLTRTDLSSPDDDFNITPTAAVCSSCHDGVTAKTHMAEQGALFEFVPFAEEAVGVDSEQIALCGPGPVSAQPAGHSSRTDCCSCHGVQ